MTTFIREVAKFKLLCNNFRSSSEVKIYIVWRNRPMREVIKFRNLKGRDCATVAERCRVLLPHPSLRVLLGYAVTIWSTNSKEGPRDRSDVTRNSTRRCFLRVLDSSVDRRDWRQCSSSKVRVVRVVKWSTSRGWAVKYEFAVSYRRELRWLFLWIDLRGIFGA
jgi:hypothetical protein